jgi:hypothetical protein
MIYTVYLMYLQPSLASPEAGGTDQCCGSATNASAAECVKRVLLLQLLVSLLLLLLLLPL